MSRLVRPQFLPNHLNDRLRDRVKILRSGMVDERDEDGSERLPLLLGVRMP